MSQEWIDGRCFSQDTKEFMALMAKWNVRYLIVGGQAVIYHGFARLTGDVDFFYSLTEQNVANLFRVLVNFWDGSIPGGITTADLAKEGQIIQFGLPPNRIDLLNRIDGVDFETAWQMKTSACLKFQRETLRIFFIGLASLIQNKQAAARPKDLVDLQYLTQALKRI